MVSHTRRKLLAFCASMTGVSVGGCSEGDGQLAGTRTGEELNTDVFDFPDGFSPDGIDGGFPVLLGEDSAYFALDSVGID